MSKARPVIVLISLLIGASRASVSSSFYHIIEDCSSSLTAVAETHVQNRAECALGCIAHLTCVSATYNYADGEPTCLLFDTVAYNDQLCGNSMDYLYTIGKVWRDSNNRYM